MSVVASTKNVIVCSVSDQQVSNYNIAFVYGSPYVRERQNVWDLISERMDADSGPWVLIGDFNQVEDNSQKLGGSRIIQGVNAFRDWKETNKLLDIPFHGVQYTWTNNREGGM